MKRSIMLGLMVAIVSLGALNAVPVQARDFDDEDWGCQRHARFEGWRNYQRELAREECAREEFAREQYAREAFARARWGGYPAYPAYQAYPVYHRSLLDRIFN